MTGNRAERSLNLLRRRALQGAVSAVALAYARVPVYAQSTSALHTLPRQALVIGNARYAQSPLDNPLNDARALAAELKGMGFDVALEVDLGRDALKKSIVDYVARLAVRKAIGLFYFAGHGAQLAWRNYLIPVDAAIKSQDDVSAQAVELNALLQGLANAANPMNVVILDACRDNPFGATLPLEQKGLSQFDAPPGSLLAYATSPGNVASDGAGANGLYTENLLRELKSPDAKIEDVFKRVRLAVRRQSKGQQVPWESTSLEQDFYFRPPKTIAKSTEQEAAQRFETELALWEKAKTSGDADLIEDYLRRYPSGIFSELAQLRLDQVLDAAGERRIQITSSDQNPYSRGTLLIDTRVKVGDRYTYRDLDLDTRAETRRYTLSAAKVTQTEVYYKIGTVTDLIGNWILLPDGRRWTDAQFFIAEYSMGKRWTSRHRYRDAKGVLFNTEFDFKVAARESVTVPAGTFDAFRVQGNGWTRGEPGAVQLTMRYWVTPGVRRYIAIENIHRAAQSRRLIVNNRLELIEYCCG